MSGKVYLVGAGPGKSDLITVRGLNILREGDVVIYDYLVDRQILDETKDGAELICCDTIGKKRYSDGFLTHSEKIIQLIIKKAKEGKKVVRLKNGDPGIFGRTSQELEALAKENIEVPIAGKIISVEAKVGDKIKEGDTVCLIESMKMENPILAPVGGKITEIKVSAGQVVEAGNLIAVIEY